MMYYLKVCAFIIKQKIFIYTLLRFMHRIKINEHAQASPGDRRQAGLLNRLSPAAPLNLLS